MVYLKGGNTRQLLDLLNKNKGWEDKLDGKTIAGTSAGAEAIATYCYDIDDLALEDGLGLLPIKVIVHYQSDYNAPNVDWEKAYHELENYKENLEVVTLREGEFKVYENITL